MPRTYSPYKGELELWYQEHLTLYTDFMLVFLTAWVILFPKSELVYRIFKDLPEKPEFPDLKLDRRAVGPDNRPDASVGISAPLDKT